MKNIKSFNLFEASYNFEMKNLYSDYKSNNHDLIHFMCRKYKIKNYTINRDGSIDVNQEVDLIAEGITKLPLKFNRVNGSFKINANKLTSLEGCPSYVQFDFWCNGNEITSLVGGPKYVGGSYMCQMNKLESFEGCADFIGSHFWCEENNIKTFDFFPKNSGTSFICYRNPISEIWDLFQDKTKIEELNDCDIFRDNGNSVILDRLNEFLYNIDKEPITSLKKYNII